uniref:Uncharacterized protein n=1 Tax=Rhipicephalus zambeziensis TaxID=60191 RepID=A0A224YI76_9ACAR
MNAPFFYGRSLCRYLFYLRAAATAAQAFKVSGQSAALKVMSRDDCTECLRLLGLSQPVLDKTDLKDAASHRVPPSRQFQKTGLTEQTTFYGEQTIGRKSMRAHIHSQANDEANTRTRCSWFWPPFIARHSVKSMP